MSNTIELVRVACPLCGKDMPAFERELAGYTLDRCKGCRFIYVNPQPSPEELMRHYASEPDGEGLIAFYARAITPSLLAQYVDTLAGLEQRLPGKGRLLDLACGPGYFYEQALRRGWDAHGADVGAWTQEAVRRRGIGNMHTGTLTDLNFPDEHFDVVYAAQVFEHLPNPKAELAEIRRIVRPADL